MIDSIGRLLRFFVKTVIQFSSFVKGREGKERLVDRWILLD
jgi:hypothetical protein